MSVVWINFDGSTVTKHHEIECFFATTFGRKQRTTIVLPASLKPQTAKKAFACFAALREIHGFVSAQLAKASHAKAQSTRNEAADPKT